MDEPVQASEQEISEQPISDQRLLKGARARASIARRAAEVASVEGLTGLSLGRLATDLGVSKSGVATLFGTKEKLQLAAVAAAREMFIDTVIRPAYAAEAGIARLQAMVEAWFVYVGEPVLPGGCFRAANAPEFDSRPGPVRDALVAERAGWFAVLEKEIGRAQAQGYMAGLDPHAVAFQLDAIVGAANVAARMGDETALPLARGIVEGLLGSAG